MNLLEKLDRLMEQQNLNKHSLSEKSGIPYTTIVGLYQNDYENTRVSTIKRLAQFFDVSLDYLVNDQLNEDAREPRLDSGLSLREHEIIRIFRKMGEGRKRVLEHLLQQEDRPEDAAETGEDYRQVARGAKSRLQPGAAQKALRRRESNPEGDLPDWNK